MAGTTGLEPAASAVTVAGFEYFQRQPKFGGFAILNCQFGWLRGSRKLLKRKDFLVAGACNHPNLLVLPFRMELIRLAA
jgi:hypothetical protein